MKKLPMHIARRLPLVATLLVCVLLYLAASLSFQGFFSPGVFLNFFNDQSFLGIAAMGTTFVILSGGIDLSVGSVLGLSGITLAALIENGHVHPYLAMAIVLAGGTLFGAAMGALIHFFELAPFMVTLGGLFMARGAALLVSSESIDIDHPVYDMLSSIYVPLPGGQHLPLTAAVFLGMALVLIFISLQTPFGRNVYALGGNENSALLMGLPVGRTKISIYALGGFCSALGGVVHTLYTSSGNALDGTGMELDAIAAVVVGGTLLSGGTGLVAGTPLGVLTFGIIQTAITFQGKLNSWWTKIAIGALLLGFVVIQRLIQSASRPSSSG
jgi:galactofuranose transport system permease protein